MKEFSHACSYVDPEAVVGCEDGKARVFDMYSRKCSQIIKYVNCLTFNLTDFGFYFDLIQSGRKEEDKEEDRRRKEEEAARNEWGITKDEQKVG